jgi:hypothetical protein
LIEVAIPLPDWVVTEVEVQAFLLAWLTREGVGFVRASELPKDGDRCH